MQNVHISRKLDKYVMPSKEEIVDLQNMISFGRKKYNVQFLQVFNYWWKKREGKDVTDRHLPALAKLVLQ